MDDHALFSSSFSTIDISVCNPAIQTAVAELQTVLRISSLIVYEYKQYVVLKFTSIVNLPSRGVVNGIDIRQREPLLMFFHRQGFPGKAPQVRIDRRDFPVASLPHLNPVWIGDPYWPCLHRGSIDDWFAEHSLSNLIERAQGWLEDAAKGRLIKEHDRFEPTRIGGGYWIGGVSIFNHQLFYDFIENGWAQNPKNSYSYVASYGSLNSVEWIRYLSDFLTESFDELLSHFKNEQEDKTALIKGMPLPGLLLWPDKENVCDQYFGALPRTIDELYKFADGLGLDLGRAISQTPIQSAITERKILPIFLCIQRPFKLINSDSNLEILSFIYLPGESNSVLIMPHREPLTMSFARQLSGVELNGPQKVLIIGCGALGSKIGLHLGRAGFSDLTLIDDDSLSPHNLVRHALLADSVGENKAKALERAIREIFLDGGQPVNIKALTGSIFDLLNQDQTLFQGAELVIDATASAATFERLASYNDPYQVPVIRCELADKGRLGIMLIEGRGHSPNISDLRASLYNLALEDSRIEEWLTGYEFEENDDLGAGLEDITVGLGCSSPTMTISDDVIGLHAATHALTVRALLDGGSQVAGIKISYLNKEIYPEVSTNFVPVEKYKSLPFKGDNGWIVRMKTSLYDLLIQNTEKATPNETGGILIGFINIKRKIINVTHQIDPPEDSVGWPYAYKLGVKGIPEQVSRIMRKTGNLIGYVGEWHSHPTGSNRLSSTDRDAIRQISESLNKIARPTFILVVTPTGCYPYVTPAV